MRSVNTNCENFLTSYTKKKGNPFKNKWKKFNKKLSVKKGLSKKNKYIIVIVINEIKTKLITSKILIIQKWYFICWLTPATKNFISYTTPKIILTYTYVYIHIRKFYVTFKKKKYIFGFTIKKTRKHRE